MTRQQAWARKALELVNAKKNSAAESTYATLCMKTPMLLKQSGLVQTISFLLRKPENQPFVNDLAAVYLAGGGELLTTAEQNARVAADARRPRAATREEETARAKEKAVLPGKDLQARAQSTDDLRVYLALSRDLQAISVWFRRFAQSELNGDDVAESGTLASEARK